MHFSWLSLALAVGAALALAALWELLDRRAASGAPPERALEPVQDRAAPARTRREAA